VPHQPNQSWNNVVGMSQVIAGPTRQRAIFVAKLEGEKCSLRRNDMPAHNILVGGLEQVFVSTYWEFHHPN